MDDRARIHEWLTIPEIVQSARDSLTGRVWDYSAGGADDEVTLRRNRSGFGTFAFNPRVLTGVGTPDVSSKLLGHGLRLPLLFAPVGSIKRFDPDGALACARVATRAGIAAFVGTLASPSLEEVRAGSNCPLFFQLYMYGDREWVAALVRRAESAGYSAICVTVDTAAYGRRERDLHHRFFPRSTIEQPNIGAKLAFSNPVLNDDFNSRLTWSDIAWLRQATDLPLMVKGITSAADAEQAVETGVDVVYVSNHGGRQLDHMPSTIEVLSEVVAAVQRRAQIVVDSGFMRGSDVVKAIALGADAVAIGKLMVWALAAGGDEGLARATELIETEMKVVMANLGAKRLDDLSPEMLRRIVPSQQVPWPVDTGPPYSRDSQAPVFI
jgi:isopentenyl diphosphate isomerase/L-lactate dehydrogenase-like FMN-dependent dehydrogenase